MKRKIFFTLLVMASTVFLLSSCLKTNDEEITPHQAVSAKIDGKYWETDIRGGIAFYSNGLLNIEAPLFAGIWKSAGNIIRIKVSATKKGTYLIGMGTGNSGTYEVGDTLYDSNLSSKMGSIKITKFDTLERRISGTFHFTAKCLSPLDSVVISEGLLLDVYFEP